MAAEEAAVIQNVGKRKAGFMPKQIGSACIRCGRERVFEKTWKEYIGTSLLTYTRSVCVDVECQKIVDEQIALQKEKRAFHAQKRLHAHQSRGKVS